MTREEAAEVSRQARARAVADFYRTGGWTEERRARWRPIWEESQRRRAERLAAEQAAQTAEPVEPTPVQADAA